MKKGTLLSILIFSQSLVWAQERTTSIVGKPAQKLAYPEQTHTVQLPFKDDFSGDAINNELWDYNNGVYLNNHMGENIPSKGIVTFDATNQFYAPYDSTSRDNTIWSDSLKTAYIDLSTLGPNDGIYLSFYYQSKGKGYAPKSNDSLYVFFKNQNGIWDKQLALAPIDTNIFLQEWIPINDAKYFFNEFQILFTNKATLQFTNSHWHLDYVEVDKNRTVQTHKNDIAIQQIQGKTLNTLSRMPWNKYIANRTANTRSEMIISVRNLSNQTQNTTANYSIVDGNNTVLHSDNINLTLPPLSSNDFQFTNPIYSNNYATDSLEFKHIVTVVDPYGNSSNDTIIHVQKFDNELAYDDNTAEQAYYLLMHPSYYIPAQTAVEYELETNDTVRGFAIHFPKSALGQNKKDFSIRLYENINTGLGQDPYIYEETFLQPKYDSTQPYGMAYYAFDRPVVIPTSRKYYLALIQPTGGASDSLYVGLDLDINSNMQRYFNVDGTWEPTQISGSLLFRLLVGKDISYLGNKHINVSKAFHIYPNPSNSILNTPAEYNNMSYIIYSVDGKKVKDGTISNNKITVNNLLQGNYLLQIKTRGGSYPLVHFIKE